MEVMHLKQLDACLDRAPARGRVECSTKLEDVAGVGLASSQVSRVTGMWEWPVPSFSGLIPYRKFAFNCELISSCPGEI